jgi:phosphoribosylanthranilate isomerase
MVWIKVCGVTSAEDAELVVSAGADAIGLNFVPASKRHLSLDGARAIVAALTAGASSRARALEIVAVVADADDALLGAVRELGIRSLQLHGSEPAARVSELLPHAFKACGIDGSADISGARLFPGERLLLDTKVAGASGGTGQVFDWELAAPLARERQLIVAGGLHAGNVGDCIRRVRPYGVDVASGVESAPGRKDPVKLELFIRAARAAAPPAD